MTNTRSESTEQSPLKFLASRTDTLNMAADSVSNAVNRVRPRITEPGKIRLVLQRLASGYYQRPEVLREVAIRILRT